MDKFFKMDITGKDYSNMVFEKIDDKIDRENLIKEAYPKALEIIKANSFKEDDFKDLYGSAVEEDKKKFKENEYREIDESVKLSEIFNAIILEEFKKKNWISENASTKGTSKFDKYTTGISNITEFNDKKGTSYMAMAIRATYSPNLRDKLMKTKENIRAGELSKIKYFNSEQNRGELKKIPSFIIGCSKEMLLEVTELWLQNKNKELSEHPIQFLIMDAIKEQIYNFRKEALSYGYMELVKIYENAKNRIDQILKDKEDLREKLENPKKGDSLKFKEENDKVMNALKVELKSVFGY